MNLFQLQQFHKAHNWSYLYNQLKTFKNYKLRIVMNSTFFTYKFCDSLHFYHGLPVSSWSFSVISGTRWHQWCAPGLLHLAAFPHLGFPFAASLRGVRAVAGPANRDRIRCQHECQHQQLQFMESQQLSIILYYYILVNIIDRITLVELRYWVTILGFRAGR